MLRWLCSSFVVLSLTAARLPDVRQVGSTPLWFEPNVGQVKGKTEWVARAPGAYLYITGAEVVFALPPLSVPRIAPAKPLYTHNVHMRLVGASAGVRGEGVEPLGSYSSYFSGKTEKDWFTGVPQYGR